MPVYTKNFPLGATKIIKSDKLMRENFQTVDLDFNVSHMDFNTDNAGKHGTLFLAKNDTGPVFNAGEIGLYYDTPALPLPETGRNELILVQSDGKKVPITARGNATNGWAILSNRMMIKWGTINANPGSNTLTFPVANSVPVFDTIYGVFLSVIGQLPAERDLYATIETYSTVNFKYYLSKRTTVGAASNVGIVYYQAFGTFNV